jgi:amino acid adenylation domain-containing protein
MSAKGLAEFSPEKIRLLARKLNDRKGSAPGAIRREDPSATRFPLSFAQERLWLIQQLMPDMPSYNAPFVLRLRLPPRPEIWEQVMTQLVRRHEVMRTTFQVVDGVPMQVVAPPSRARIAVHDLRHLPAAQREARALEIVREDISRQFDFAVGPLWRYGVICIDDNETINYSTVHHSICDGSSRQILLSEVPQLAVPLFSGLPPVTLPPLPVQYGDYARWQREQIQNGAALDGSLKYWTNQLAGFSELDLHTDYPRPPIAQFRAGSVGLTLPYATVDRLKQLSKGEHATLFMTMLAAFDVLLQRYTGQDDILVGTPVSTRSRVELEPLIGYFVNTLALRGDLSGDPTFRELLGRVRKVCVDGYANKELPFERLVQELSLKRDLSRNPLFQVSFQLEDVAASTGPGGGGPAGVADYMNFDHFAMTVANLDLDVHLFGEWDDAVVKKADGMRGIFTYDADLFTRETIERLVGHYRVLLDAVAASPDVRLSELPLLTAGEQQQVIEWNSTDRLYGEESLVSLFEEQAARDPFATALVFEGRTLTYDELNCRANQLAHRLRAFGVGPESLVGICAERSFEMVVGLLGILKAGGAYVPLSPSEPEARLRQMIADAGIAVVVAQDSAREEWRDLADHVVRLTPAFDAIDRESERNPDVAIDPHNLAYSIWTSGSTGKPKGAMNTHASLMNILRWMEEAHPLEPGDRVLQKTAFNFDVSILEFFCPLIAGATLVIAKPGGHRDPQYLAALMADERVSVVHFVPSMLDAFLQAREIDRCASLRTVICIGEAVTPALSREFFARCAARLHNMYGPAEAAVAVTHWPCSAADTATVPIGGPIANTQIHVLDGSFQATPVGVPGEIYIGGVNVGRGYLGRPDLTADRFVPDPFSIVPGSRLYRTGDRARRLPDGTLEFLGRRDYQVKIRGNRVELGEIESALADHPAVQIAVVTVNDDAARGRTLAAYYVPNGGASCDAIELRDYLKSRLPDYMIPSDFVRLESFPRTSSGKVDRKALPRPDARTLTDLPVAPRDTVELELTHIWKDLLGKESVGVCDDFFLVGGHSLLAVRLLARIRDAFGQDVPLAAFYQNPTIEQIAVSLRANDGSKSASPLIAIKPGKTGAPPLFLMHAAGGRSINYYGLARAIYTDHPIYGLEDVTGVDLSVVEMAARYVAAVRGVQPHGPYHLAGWSTGATVAFEMSRQLRAAGEDIGLVGLFDGFSPYTPKLSASDPDAASARVLSTIARNLSIFSGQHLTITDSDLAGLSAEERMAYFLAEAKSRNVFPPDLSMADVRAFLDASDRHVRAFWSYVPAVSDERLVLFRSADPLEWAIEEETELAELPEFGWQKLSSQPVVVHLVPGNHVTMFQQPNINALARVLAGELEEARVGQVAAAVGT